MNGTSTNRKFAPESQQSYQNILTTCSKS